MTDTILDMLDTLIPMAMDTMESVTLMLSPRPRLMLILIFCIEEMDMLDMVDTHTDMDMLDTTASVTLMLSPRLMLILIFCMEEMDMLDMVDTQTDMDMLDTTASVTLMLSPRPRLP